MTNKLNKEQKVILAFTIMVCCISIYLVVLGLSMHKSTNIVIMGLIGILYTIMIIPGMIYVITKKNPS